MLHRFVQFSFLLLALLYNAQSLPFASNNGGLGGNALLTQERPEPAGGSSTTNDYVDEVSSLTLPYYYRCRCDQSGPPVNMLESLKRDVFRDPHPMYILSETAEFLHQYIICQNCGPVMADEQMEDEAAERVKGIMLQSLNTLQTSDTCPPRYKITYNPKRYPRYLVEVVCSEKSEHNVERELSCSMCSSDSTERGTCRKQWRANMPYLTNDPSVPGCAREGWHSCLIDVGVGCRCENQ